VSSGKSVSPDRMIIITKDVSQNNKKKRNKKKAKQKSSKIMNKVSLKNK
jgi:hypothetical protein